MAGGSSLNGFVAPSLLFLPLRLAPSSPTHCSLLATHPRSPRLGRTQGARQPSFPPPPGLREGACAASHYGKAGTTQQLGRSPGLPAPPRRPPPRTYRRPLLPPPTCGRPKGGDSGTAHRRGHSEPRLPAPSTGRAVGGGRPRLRVRPPRSRAHPQATRRECQAPSAERRLGDGAMARGSARWEGRVPPSGAARDGAGRRGSCGFWV